MPTRRRTRSIARSRARYLMMKKTVAIVMLSMACGAPLFAQDEQGATVGATVAAVNMSSTTEASFSGSAGYQFTRMMGLEIEATSVPRLRGSFPGSSTSISALSSVSGVALSSITAILPGTSLNVTGGRAVFFTTNVRVRLPTTSPRVTPYFVAGGGTASIRRSTDISLFVPLAGAPNIPIPIARPITEHLTQSSTDLALTLGGGVDVMVASHASVGGDFRYYRLLDDQDSNVGRFGASVRYRF
jgi:opacity protein-like surface antigen